MTQPFAYWLMFTILLISQLSVRFAKTSDVNESTKYLDAVREFADNVLKYGRDTYGPKHTPLFVEIATVLEKSTFESLTNHMFPERIPGRGAFLRYDVTLLYG